jgi:hypothetical protein
VEPLGDGLRILDEVRDFVIDAFPQGRRGLDSSICAQGVDTERKSAIRLLIDCSKSLILL